MTLEQLRDETRAVVSLEEAARALGIGRTCAQEQARREGRLGPVPILRIGRLYKVPTSALQRALGIEPAAMRG